MKYDNYIFNIFFSNLTIYLSVYHILFDLFLYPMVYTLKATLSLISQGSFACLWHHVQNKGRNSWYKHHLYSSIKPNTLTVSCIPVHWQQIANHIKCTIKFRLPFSRYLYHMLFRYCPHESRLIHFLPSENIHRHKLKLHLSYSLVL